MTAQAIPTIETRRLLLKGPKPQDYPNFKATFTSYRSRFVGGPFTPYESWMRYASEIGHWNIRGYGMWMIHEKESGETLGMAGGWYPAGWPEREIAWIIWPHKAGQGYALEATHAARAYFYGNLGWKSAVSYIDPANLDSIRLAQRLGAERDANAKTIDGNDVVYRHPAPQQLQSSQIADGIELEISHYCDPLFKMKGMPVD